MSTMHHHHSQQPNPLAIMQLAEFDANMGDLPEEEKKRKRRVYLRDALRQTGTAASILKGFGCFLIPFAIIPIFWPVLIFFWFMRKKTTAMMEAQLNTALDYWGIARDEIVNSTESFSA